MNTINFKKAMIISLFVSSAPIHAELRPQIVLAKQCYELGGLVFSLMSFQSKSRCIERLDRAADLLEHAGEHILENIYPIAKIELDNAMHELRYAQLLSCARYIEIAHSQLEVRKIKEAL